MRKGFARAAGLLTCAFLAIFSWGCGSTDSTVLYPLPANDGAQLSLGPGVTPLTRGPGYKSAPEWSPDGEDISYITDGYVVDKTVRSTGDRPITTRDFDARSLEWLSNGSVLILGNTGSGTEPSDGYTLYTSSPGTAASEISEVATDVLALNASEPGGEILFASRSGRNDSEISLIGTDRSLREFDEPVDGTVTGISFSPSRDTAALSVSQPGERTGMILFDLVTGERRTLSTLPRGQTVTGSPQWTTNGIYFIGETAGSSRSEDGNSTASEYALYRINPETERPERAAGPGNEFLPSSMATSPDGRLLGVVGRLRSDSPSNLYILDTVASELRAATNNEDMEIKNGSQDISWSPDGESIVIIARGTFSGAVVRSIPAESLLDEFYNLYEVPVEST